MRGLALIALLFFNISTACAQNESPSAPAPKEKTPRETSDLHFRSRDRDNDGVLTLYEYIQHSKLRFSILDIDRNGYTTIDEYYRAMEDSPGTKGHPSMSEIYFAEDDLDKDGKITQFENLQSVHLLFEQTDKNHDGLVTPDEFYAYSQKHL